MLVCILLGLLLVLSTFVLGGGGSVAIGWYIRLLWDIAVGMYIDLYLWFTVDELRLLDVRVILWGCVPRW